MLTTILLCAVAYVNDGDTLRCFDGTRVRLAAIDAPEMHGCHGRPGRVCVSGDPVASKRNLERLTLGRTLQCRQTGTSDNRIVAWCSADGADLSCAQVTGGFAVHWLTYDRRGELCRR